MGLRTIRDVATRDVVTVPPDASARELARRIRDEAVGSVVVDGDEPVGVVTDRDLTVRVLAEGGDGTDRTARELMTDHHVTVRDDRGVSVAARRMNEHGVRRMPVVDRDGTLVGIATLLDVYRELVADREHLANVVAAEPSG